MKLSRNTTAALLIDVQERLHPHMHDADALSERIGTLLEGLKVLDIPVLATEQYSKGLGPTISTVRSTFDAFAPIEKIAFSCCGTTEFDDALRRTGRRQVVIAGIEAHVCVLQTALDLVGEGYDVLVVADCTSSRRAKDAEFAYRRMELEGVRLGTYESVLLELCTVAGTPEFKAISKLIK